MRHQDHGHRIWQTRGLRTLRPGKEVQVGQGQVNFGYLLQKMKDAGFDGDITIEREIQEGPERDRQILEEKEYLEEIIEQLR